MKFEIKKDEGMAGKSKRYRFELSFGGVLGLGAVVVVGMVWVFIFGVLVGRGYQPEKQVPELATLMPASKAETARKTSQSKEENKVIRPEELDYYSNLKEVGKNKKTAARQAAAPAKTQAEPAAAVVKTQAEEQSQELKTIVPASPKATARMTTAKKNKPVKTASKPAAPVKKAKADDVKPRPGMDKPVNTQASKKQLAEKDEDTQVYDYVYQIASLQNPQSAKRFRDKVNKLGLQAEVNVIRTDSKIWHRVVVHFRGMPEDTREMKEKLREVGVEKPLMTSKKPI